MAKREPARSESSRCPRSAGLLGAGRTPESAVQARSLLLLGVTNPVTGAPFTEAMLFGISGGIGASYFYFEYETFITLYVGGRINSALQKRDFLEVGFERLDLDVTVRTASTPAAAEKALRSAFEGSRPIIAMVDQALLPLHWVPRELAGTTLHPVLVAEGQGNRWSRTSGESRSG